MDLHVYTSMYDCMHNGIKFSLPMNFFDVFGGRRGEFFDAPLRGSLEGGGGIWSRSASKSGAEDVVFCFSCSKRSIACVVRPSSFCLLFGSPSFFCCEHCVLDVCKE